MSLRDFVGLLVDLAAQTGDALAARQVARWLFGIALADILDELDQRMARAEEDKSALVQAALRLERAEFYAAIPSHHREVVDELRRERAVDGTALPALPDLELKAKRLPK